MNSYLATLHDQPRSPETPHLLRFLTVAGCPSYTAVQRQWSALPCCCCSNLEQSAPTCHVRIVTCFPRSPHGFPHQSSGVPSHYFHHRLHFVLPAQWQLGYFNRSFYLLALLFSGLWPMPGCHSVATTAKHLILSALIRLLPSLWDSLQTAGLLKTYR